jgi:hypothetical protein
VRRRELNRLSAWAIEAARRLGQSILTLLALGVLRLKTGPWPRVAAVLARLKPHLYPLVGAIVTFTLVLSGFTFLANRDSSGIVKPVGQATQANASDEEENLVGVTYHVFATREGMVGSTTANGHLIKPRDHFVALPSPDVVCKDGSDAYRVKVSYKGRSAVEPVWDVGPWNHNDNYWDPIRNNAIDLPLGVPEAQYAYFTNYNNGKDGYDRKVTVPAGIDLADGTFWDDLGMTANDWVDVTFLWLKEPVVLPTDPAQALADDPDGSEFVPETNHNLRGAFREYWHANGGLPVFGYPLTEEFTEGGLIVQYFERARFEYHPDLPDPYKVSLTHLGRLQTNQQQFQEVEKFSNEDEHWFFSETNHSLNWGFLRYWQDNGALPVFGLPISEETNFVSSTGEQLTVQYFERQRLEYHPDQAGTPYAIQLGQLGRELLLQKGWLVQPPPEPTS